MSIPCYICDKTLASKFGPTGWVWQDLVTKKATFPWNIQWKLTHLHMPGPHQLSLNNSSQSVRDWQGRLMIRPESDKNVTPILFAEAMSTTKNAKDNTSTAFGLWSFWKNRYIIYEFAQMSFCVGQASRHVEKLGKLNKACQREDGPRWDDSDWGRPFKLFIPTNTGNNLKHIY